MLSAGEYSALRAGIFQASGSTDPMWSFEERRSDAAALRSSPAGLSLSMVASPQCRFRFARHDHCSSATTFGLNFRMRRHPGLIPYGARSGPCSQEKQRTSVLPIPTTGTGVRTKLTALFSAELRQGRSDQGSSPCSRTPQSHPRTPAASRCRHRLPPGLGAGSWNRRRDQ